MLQIASILSFDKYFSITSHTAGAPPSDFNELNLFVTAGNSLDANSFLVKQSIKSDVLDPSLITVFTNISCKPSSTTAPFSRIVLSI